MRPTRIKQVSKNSSVTVSIFILTKAVLHNVDSANAVVMADLVQVLEDIHAAGDLLVVRSDNLDRNTGLEVDGEIRGLIRGIERVHGSGPQLLAMIIVSRGLRDQA